jgi:hypothetical protein
MRVALCAVVLTVGLALRPAAAEPDRAGTAFWKAVQGTCNATAAKPASALGQRIAQTAIDEFNHFGGHQIDANGRLFHFGLTEAEHDQDDAGTSQAKLGQLGWWQVMKYWRALYGEDAPSKLEVRGYHDGSVSMQDGQDADLMRTSAAELMRAADSVSDPAAREVLRETALRAAAVDTSWSAAFISYVIKQAGVAPTAFHFANAHRAFIYDAVATSAGELKHEPSEQIYRACPLTNTRPRLGDVICAHREAALSNLREADVRERIRSELESGGSARSIRRAHCEVVAHIDAGARKVYTIGGNVNQAVAARKLNLYGRGLKFSGVQGSPCGGRGAWTLRQPESEKASASGHETQCSLNDKKWFVLLQLR